MTALWIHDCITSLISSLGQFVTTIYSVIHRDILVRNNCARRGPRKKTVESHRKIRWMQNFLKDFGWLEWLRLQEGSHLETPVVLSSPLSSMPPCRSRASLTLRHQAMNECDDMGDLLDWCRTGGFPVLTLWAGCWLPVGFNFKIQEPRRPPAGNDVN